MNAIDLNLSLSRLSLVFIFASMAVYTIAFLIFTWQLAQASSTSKNERSKSAMSQKWGFGLLIAAAVIHGAGVVMRGIAAGRVPWANMYEFSISGSFVLVLIFLLSIGVKEIRVIAAFVTGFALLVLGSATTIFYVDHPPRSGGAGA